MTIKTEQYDFTHIFWISPFFHILYGYKLIFKYIYLKIYYTPTVFIYNMSQT